MTTTPDGPAPIETLTQGGTLSIAYVSGGTETIRIRQLKIREMDALLKAQGDETKLALLYTGKDEAWLDGLTPESHEEIVKEGDRINSDFFGRWFQRRLDRQERLAPGSRARLLALFSPPTDLGPSPTSLPLRPVPVG